MLGRTYPLLSPVELTVYENSGILLNDSQIFSTISWAYNYYLKLPKYNSAVKDNRRVMEAMSRGLLPSIGGPGNILEQS